MNCVTRRGLITKYQVTSNGDILCDKCRLLSRSLPRMTFQLSMLGVDKLNNVPLTTVERGFSKVIVTKPYGLDPFD